MPCAKMLETILISLLDEIETKYFMFLLKAGLKKYWTWIFEEEWRNEELSGESPMKRITTARKKRINICFYKYDKQEVL